MSGPLGGRTSPKSLMVKHIVHLKTFRSLGQRTNELHVIQFPVAKPLLWPPAPFLSLRWRDLPLVLIIEPSSSVESESSSPPSPTRPCFFFLPENSEGNGWLIDRECCGRGGLTASPCDVEVETGIEERGWMSESEELESARTCEVSRTLRSPRRPARDTVSIEGLEPWRCGQGDISALQPAAVMGYQCGRQLHWDAAARSVRKKQRE